MPRFYLNVVDHGETLRDDEGIDLPDIEAARHEAREAIREILADAIRANQEISTVKIEITDGAGSVLETVGFRPTTIP
jgi:hypothetical protein